MSDMTYWITLVAIFALGFAVSKIDARERVYAYATDPVNDADSNSPAVRKGR